MPEIIGLIKDIASSKCKFFDKCPGRDSTSETCKLGGGEYCGRWRVYNGGRL